MHIERARMWLIPAEVRELLALHGPDRHAVRGRDVDQLAAKREVAGHVETGPLCQHLAGSREQLDAVVLTITDIQRVVGIGGDEVHQSELAGSGAWLTPGALQ